MAKPVLSETAERLYNQLAPTYFKEDEQYGWPGATLIAGLSKMVDPTAEAVQPTGEKPGFAILMEPEHVAEMEPEVLATRWLEWLGQFVGMTPTKLSTAPNLATKRKWIEYSSKAGVIQSPINWTRGAEGAIRLAAEATLTGAKSMYFYTRYNGEAFLMKIATLTSQTPNPTKTKEVIEGIMPAWIVLEYSTVTGGTMAILEASHALMSEIEATHATVEDAELHPEK